MRTDYIECGNSEQLLKTLPDESIDLVVTSPPYDNLRNYEGFTFNFKGIANQLFRVLKPGGVIVWVVADSVINGSESGNSFKQALYFKHIGLNLHDTMIWEKDTVSMPEKLRYANVFEYMFVLSKGKPKTINKIVDRKNKWAGSMVHGTKRNPDGSTVAISGLEKRKTISEYGARWNVWHIPTEKNSKAYGHPAMFPQTLARDHIVSWSNKGDIVLDPFSGAGTTCVEAFKNDRHYIGFDISEKYCGIANRRVQSEKDNAMGFCSDGFGTMRLF